MVISMGPSHVKSDVELWGESSNCRYSPVFFQGYVYQRYPKLLYILYIETQRLGGYSSKNATHW